MQGTPNGEQWEVYTITDDAPATNASGDAADAEVPAEGCCA